ncbi:hypothetical protein ABH924_003314 [Arthrobacter sp. GAS37]|uniref:hypothetical protein n=1 Tax=Arthrobacter sp. GAS37 TaxID=3156261 RepID=UPI003833A5BD
MLVAALSLSDAPGCTTAAIALAQQWPRPVILVEADTSHASSVLPGLFKGEQPQRFGVLDLAALHRNGELTEEAVLTHALRLGGDSEHRIIPGFTGPGPAQSAASSWGALTDLFVRLEEAGVDVLADLGRFGPSDPRTALLTRADTVAVFAAADLPGLYSMRTRLPELREALSTGSDAARLGVVLRQHPAAIQGYSAREVRSALNTTTWGTIPWDPAGAAAYSHGTQKAARPLSRRQYERSIAALGTTIREAVATRRSELGSIEGSNA